MPGIHFAIGEDHLGLRLGSATEDGDDANGLAVPWMFGGS